jgi:hypothetical protein
MMRYMMRYLSCFAVWLCAMAAANDVCHAVAADAVPETIDLALPRTPVPGEAVWLEIGAGNFTRGKIRVTTRDGQLIGTVASFGTQRSPGGVTYKLPLPQSAIVNGHVELSLEIDQPGVPPHAPKPGEVESVKLIYVPVSK